MRLINADKLRSEILLNCQKCSRNGTNFCRFVCDLHYYTKLVDNAPTVELTEEQAIDKLTETGWLKEHDKIMTDRPHGKWIDRYPLTYECSICRGDALDVNEYPYQSNFCPHCGADMRESNTNGVDNI